MILFDVNVLVYAHREDSRDHLDFRDYFEQVLNADAAYGYSELVLSGFIRVVTHPKVFEQPTVLDVALDVVNLVRGLPQAIAVSPGPRHWAIFENLVRTTRAQGNLVPDAYHAALAIESGCDWVTTDRGFRRFPGLRARHPLGKAL